MADASRDPRSVYEHRQPPGSCQWPEQAIDQRERFGPGLRWRGRIRFGTVTGRYRKEVKEVVMREPDGRAAIAGLGMTELGKVFGRSPRRLAADAVRLAVADAGLTLADVDGLLVSHGMSGSPGIELAASLGLRELRLLTQLTAFGATAGAMISYAAMSVLSGAASTVACVFADAPLRPEQSAGAAYHRDAPEYHGFGGMTAALGFRSVNAFYALAAQRHMARYGTTSEQLGAIAVATREWAA